MPSRYDNVKTVINNENMYYNYLQERGKKFVEQYTTYTFKQVTQDIKSRLKSDTHVWSYGDRYFKIAANYYGDSRYWWLIAWFNEKPTEQHNNIGDIIYIPQPLNEALSFYYGG